MYPVYTLKEYCFQQCESLERVILSKETKKLMHVTFCDCRSLKNIGYETTFGLDLEHIDLISWATFAYCTSLKSVRLHDNNVIEVELVIMIKQGHDFFLVKRCIEGLLSVKLYLSF